MRLLCTCTLFAALLVGAGCGKKEISSIDRKQAATYVSEAEFAVTLRDFARAEGLFVQATALCPDAGEYWIGLGSTRMRLGQRDGARTAYGQALKAFEAKAGKEKNAESALQQVYVLALLGRPEEARALLAKLSERYPDDRDVRMFIDEQRLERIMSDRQFKELAL